MLGWLNKLVLYLGGLVMRSDWETYKLSEIVLIIGGGTPKRSQKEYWEGGTIPWLSVKDFNGPNRYVEVTSEKITEQGLSKSSTKILNSGDLIISARGTVGEIAQLKKPMAFNQSCYGLRALQTHTINNYLYYLIKFHIDSLRQNAHGGVFDTITTDTFKLVDVILPPLAEQKRIAALLGSLDDLIENNRKMNEVLEEMAQAIFKSWFIDFDGVPEEDLVESELGLIPRGWEVKPITSLIQLNPRLKVNKDRITKYIDMKALSTNSCEITSFIEREFQGGGSKFENGDTLLARITPCLENGKTAFVSLLDKGEIAVGSTEFIVLRATDKVCAEWVYCLARSNTFRSFAISNMTGSSGRQRVPDNCFSNFHMPEPNSDIMFRFKELTESLFQQIASNQKKIQTLSELRDTLLPKLISGELRIPEAEKIVEDLL
jgi:type I restriction enzyme S subunit